MKAITIDSHKIGAEYSAYIIAEAGFNHGGDMNIAVKMIEEAAKAGANAIKFQSFQAAELVLEHSPHYELIRSGELSRNDHIILQKAAHEHQITFISTPFSFECADMLERIDVAAYKVASMDLTHLPLLRYIAQKGKPMLVSTGMGTLGDIEQAISVIHGAGNRDIVLLHCLSEYPTPAEHVNLRTISQFQSIFGLPIGYSDHTLGITIALAAATIGACVIEKHFTLDKSLPGPDHQLSADPSELQQLIGGCRTIAASLGRPVSLFERPDKAMQPILRRSIFAKAAIKKGTILDESLIRYVRPGEYLPPGMSDTLIGRTIQRDIAKDEPITWNDFFGENPSK